VGALGHYFEEEGIATTQISLVREHTDIIQPPRALWVPFMLGRPFGAPNAPEFQRKVLIAALRLLEAEQGPVLEDYPEDAPLSVGATDDGEGFACPVNLSRPRTDGEGQTDTAVALLAEIEQLLPWHDLAIRRLGRSTMGISGLSIEEAARYVVAHLDEPPPPTYDAELSAAEALKRACDDLKAFYLEAATAQPGNRAGDAIEKWFWEQATAGGVFLDLRDVCRKRADQGMQALGRSLLVPRGVA
jgi:hypothetical protein